MTSPTASTGLETITFPDGRVLSAEQIEHFITRGWVKIPAAFPPEAAPPCRDFLWEQIAPRGVLRDAPETWTKPMVFLSENYDCPPFVDCATPRLDQAITDLIGDGRWHAQGQVGWWGWWPINFAVGAEQPWDVPADEWHFDGPQVPRFVTSGDQGLLVICLFSELAPRGGGTLIAEGSHRLVAQFMRDNPGLMQNDAIAGCRKSHPWLRALCGREGDDNAADIANNAPLPSTNTSYDPARRLLPTAAGEPARTPRMARFMDTVTVDEHGTELRVVELSGSPGDVFLGHANLFHSPSFNHSGRPRFMCNRKTTLFEDLQFDRADGNYSPLEESVRRVLGK